MKSLLILLLTSLACLPSIAQNVPIDYESGGNGANWTWTVFENDTNPPLEIIANPDPTGINPSATVAKFTALQAGNPWAGCESLHGAGIGTWTIDSSNYMINIMVWKSVTSDVGIKLVRVDNWSLGEIKIANTTVNQWEQITFDFSAHIGNTYDQIVIFPDFDLAGRSSDRIIYFDNVYGPDATATSIEENNTPYISLYPNPAQSEVNIQSRGVIENVEVYSISGERVISAQADGAEVRLNISDLAPGLYVVRTKVDGQVVVDKLLKK